jgi:hypothetical protein
MAGEVDVDEIALLGSLTHLLQGVDDVLIYRVMVAVFRERQDIFAAWGWRKQLRDVLWVDVSCVNKVLLDYEDVINVAAQVFVLNRLA